MPGLVGIVAGCGDDVSAHLVSLVQAVLLQNAAGQQEACAVSCRVVAEAHSKAIATQLVRVGGGYNDISS